MLGRFGRACPLAADVTNAHVCANGERPCANGVRDGANSECAREFDVSAPESKTGIAFGRVDLRFRFAVARRHINWAQPEQLSQVCEANGVSVSAAYSSEREMPTRYAAEFLRASARRAM